MDKSVRLFHTVVKATRKTAEKATTPKYLLLTNTVTCGCLLAAGDVASQMIERVKATCEAKHWNKERTTRFLTYGLLMGPVNHLWYEMLDKLLPKVNIRVVLRKIAMDQAIFAPITIIAFFVGLGCLEGRSFSHNIEMTKSNFIPVYKVDLCVWPAAQLVNFYLVSPQYRVIYIAMMTVAWSTFLAYYRENMKVDASNTASFTRLEKSMANIKAEGVKYLTHKPDPTEQEILSRSRHILEKVKL